MGNMADKRFFFERNLLALSQSHRELCARLTGARTTTGRYRFLEAKNGGSVPAIAAADGSARPLHSTVDPRREAERLLASVEEGFVATLGFGGGWHVQAALARNDCAGILVIDYDVNGFAELLCAADFVTLLEDRRLRILVDPSPAEVEQAVAETYRPALAGGIRVLPLRVRTEFPAERRLFTAAADAVQRGIARVSADYSVQAWFGRRWFANIIRNLGRAETGFSPVPPVREAVVCAAGPSLEGHLDDIRTAQGKQFVIAVDTSLPALLGAGVRPDAVVSLDCQHISYRHFLAGLPEDVPLFLDLASPPPLASLAKRAVFFSAGHPLETLLCRRWRHLPALDSSGGNVTYTAVSLAEALGAARITTYGADFSYPAGRSYARGTYIYGYFDAAQNRFAPTEARFSAFLYRVPLEKVYGNGEDGAWRYETAALRRYRDAFERKTAARQTAPARERRLFAPGPVLQPAAAFLSTYRDELSALPLDNWKAADWATLESARLETLFTLLPLAAYTSRTGGAETAGSPGKALAAARDTAAAEIGMVLKTLYGKQP